MESGTKNERALRYVYFTFFASVVCYMAAAPMVPIFAQKLGAGYGDLGLIGVAHGLPYIFVPLVAGMLADRIGRLRVYILSLFLNSVTVLLLAFSHSIFDIILARMLNGVAIAFLWPATEMLIYDLSLKSKRVKNIGRFGIALGMGFVIGPYVAGNLVQTLGLSALFVICAAIGCAGVVVALVTISPSYVSRRVVNAKTWNLARVYFTSLIPIYVLTIIASANLGIVLTILPGYMNYLRIPAFEIGVVFTILGASRVLAYMNVERFEKLGEVRALAICFAMFSLSCIMLSNVYETWSFASAVIPFAIAFSVSAPILLNMASRNFPSDGLGVAVGIYEVANGVGWMVGPALGGVVSEAVSPSSPYAILGAATLVMMIIIPLAGKIRTEHSSPSIQP